MFQCRRLNFSPADTDEIRSKLEDLNLNKIMNLHASYVSCIRKCLKRKRITPKDLCAYLLYLPAFKERIKGPLLRKKLEEATTIDDIFIALNDVCSYHNCDIFQSIVKEYCSDQSQEELKYPEYLKAYMESHKVAGARNKKFTAK